MSCKITYNGKRYDSVQELYKDVGGDQQFTGKALHSVYLNIFEKMYKLQFSQLSSELNLQLSADGSYYTYDKAKMQKLLMSEALKRNYSINSVHGLDTDSRGFKMPLWTNISRSDLESLLNSVVDSRLRQLYMPGGSFVLGTEEGFRIKKEEEGLPSGVVFTDSFKGSLESSGENKKIQILAPWTYRDKNGKLLDIKEFMTNGKIDNNKLPRELREFFAFRIPTQGHNSMAQVEIVGFLPRASGQLLIGSRDFTVQMGSDFDIDKLFMYGYNYYRDSEGKLQKVDNRTTTDDVSGPETDWDILQQLKEEIIPAEVLDKQQNLEMKQLQNQLLAVHMSIMSHPQAQSFIYEPLGFGDLPSLAEDVHTHRLKRNQVLDLYDSPTITARIPDKNAEAALATGELTLRGWWSQSQLYQPVKLKGNDIIKIKGVLHSIEFLRKEGNSDFVYKVIPIKPKSQVIKKFNPLSPSAQRKGYTSAVRGKLGTAVFSSDATFNAVIQGLNLRLYEYDEDNNKIAKIVTIGDTTSNGYLGSHFTLKTQEALLAAGFKQIKLSNDLTDQRYRELESEVEQDLDLLLAAFNFNAMSFEDFQARFTDIQWKALLETWSEYDKKGNFEDFMQLAYYNKLAYPDPLNFLPPQEIKYKSEVISAFQSVAVDNEKAQIIGKINVNSNTFPVIKTLALLGFNESEIVAFINQDIILDYIDNLQTIKSTLGDYSSNPSVDAAQKVFSNPKYNKVNSQWTKYKESPPSLAELNNTIKTGTHPDFANMQAALLYQFMELEYYGQNLSSAQSVLNADSKGVEQDFISVADKLTQLKDLPGVGGIDNLESLIGKIHYLDPGDPRYIRLSAEGQNFWVLPKTLGGLSMVYSNGIASKVFRSTPQINDISIHDSLAVSVVTDQIMNIMDFDRSNVFKRRAIKQDILDHVISYIQTRTDLGITDTTVHQDRKRLFFTQFDKKTKINLSLAEIINRLKSNPIFAENPFLNRLSTEINGLTQPSLVIFNSAVRDGFDDTEIYRGFVDLIVSEDRLLLENIPLVLGDTPQRTDYTTRMLASDLIQYSILSGNIQQAIQFSKYVPTKYLQAIPYAAVLRNIDFNTAESLKIKTTGNYWDVSEFTTQYMQHNPDLAFTLYGTEKVLENQYLKNVEKTNKKIISFTLEEPLDKRFPVFVSLYINNEYKLYKYNGNKYTQISTLGSFGLREYDYDSDNAISNIRIQNPPKGSPTPPTSTPPADRSRNPLLDINNTSDAFDYIILNSKNEMHKELAKQLALLQQSYEIKLVPELMSKKDGTTPIAGKTKRMNRGKPWILLNESMLKNGSQNHIETVLLHESLHAVLYPILLDKDEHLLSTELKGLKRRLEAFKSAFKAKLEALGPKNFPTTDEIENTTSGETYIEYANESLAEFTAVALTHPEFQKVMDNTEWNSGQTAWDKFVELMALIFAELGIQINKPMFEALKSDILKAAQLIDAGISGGTDIPFETLGDRREPFKGSMHFSYNGNQAKHVKSKTTFEAIVNGERTATTRNRHEYWGKVKAGDYITFDDGQGNTVLVRAIKDAYPVKGMDVEEWSHLEGWSVDYGKKLMQRTDDNTVQIQFVVIQPKTDNINIWFENDENGHLSNFAPRPFYFEGQQYNSVEQAFQYMKHKYADDDPDLKQKILQSSDPFEIKRLGKKFNLDTKKWDEQATALMEELIYQSFIQNKEAADSLLLTGDQILSHNTNTKDKWRSAFPKILMKVRDRIRKLDNENITSQQLFKNVHQITKDGVPVVSYKGKTYLHYHTNTSGNAQLIDLSDNSKFPGTPKPDKLEIIGYFPKVTDEKNYSYTLTDTVVISHQSGNVIVDPKLIEKLRGSKSPDVDISDKYILNDGNIATPSQQRALDKLEEFVNQKEEKIFVLTGRAGTGKTSIVNKVIAMQEMRVAGMTPTHAAKTQLRLKGIANSFTIHSGLGYKKLKDKETGKFYFGPDAYTQPRLKDNHIIILDEASMVDPEMAQNILSFLENFENYKLIIMGDNVQLGPILETKLKIDSIEDTMSPLLKPTKYSAHLTERVRQGDDSPILAFTDLFANAIEKIYKVNTEDPKSLLGIKTYRTSLGDYDAVPITKQETEKYDITNNPITQDHRRSNYNADTDRGIVFISPQNVLDNFIADFKKDVNNPYQVRYICFTNATKDRTNAQIRRKLFGDDAKNQFVVGETVVANESHFQDRKLIVENSAAYKVVAVHRTHDLAIAEDYYEVIPIEINNPDTDQPAPIYVNVFTPASQQKWNMYIKGLNAKKEWRKKFQAIEDKENQVVDIGYGYAVTSHKVQGSTLKYAYVNEDDIMNKVKKPTILERLRSFYTAASRPSHKLVVISNDNNEETSFDMLPWSEKMDLEVEYGVRHPNGDIKRYKSYNAALKKVQTVNEALKTRPGKELKAYLAPALGRRGDSNTYHAIGIDSVEEFDFYSSPKSPKYKDLILTLERQIKETHKRKSRTIGALKDANRDLAVAEADEREAIEKRINDLNQKLLSHDQKLNNLDIDLEKAKEATQFEDLYSYATSQLKEAEEIIDNINLADSAQTAADIAYAKRLIRIWQKAGDFSNTNHIFLDSEEMASLKVRSTFQDFRNKADILDSRLTAITETVLVNFVKSMTSKGLDEKTILTAVKDSGMLAAQFLSLDRASDPMVQAVAIAMKKQNFLAERQASLIWQKVDDLLKKALPKLKSLSSTANPFDVFLQRFSDGNFTGNMVFRYTQEFMDTKTRIRGDNPSSLVYIKWLNENTILMDPRILVPMENDDFHAVQKYDDKQVKKYRKELISHLGQNGYETLLNVLTERITQFKASYQIMKDQLAKGSEEDKDRLKLWVTQNSPYYYAQMVQTKKPLTYKGQIVINSGYKYTLTIPRKYKTDKQGNQVETGWYDKNFEQIEQDPDLLALYDFFIDTLKDMRSILPYYKTKDLPLNFIPIISKDLEEAYIEGGFKMGFKPIHDMLKGLATTYPQSPLVTSDTDPLTKEPDKTAQLQFMNNNKDKIQQLLDVEYAHFKTTHGREPSKLETRQMRQQIINDLVSEQTMDLGKIIKAFSLWSLGYKHKSAVEDILKMTVDYFKTQREEAQQTASGESFIDKFKRRINKPSGLKNYIAMLEHNLDVFLGYPSQKVQGVIAKKSIKVPKDYPVVGGKTLISTYTAREKLVVTKIEETMAKNKLDYKEGKISLEEFEATQDFLADQKNNIGSNFAWSKFGDMILKYVQLKGMGWNMPSAFANMGFGFIGNLIEGADGRAYTISDYIHALRLIPHSIAKNYSFNKYESDTAAKIRNLMDSLDALKDASNELYKASYKSAMNKGKALGPFQPQKRGEYINQAPVMIAMMLNKNKYFIYDKDNNKVAIWEAFGKDGQIDSQRFPTYRQQGWGNNGEKFFKFKTHLDSTIAKIHGNYDPEKPLLIKREVLGRALSQFRTWMFEGIASRFEDQYFDYSVGYERKGRYRSLPEVFGSYNKLVSTLINYFKFTSHWGTSNLDTTFSEVDAANIRGMFVEINVGITLYLITLLLRNLVLDDDDTVAKGTVNFLINMGTRMETDIYLYINPLEFEKLQKNTIPAFRLLSEISDWMGAVHRFVLGDDIIETGIYVDESRLFRTTGKLLPGGSAYFKMKSTVETLYERK